MSGELGYEEDRYFNVETYVRWYEAIEKAVVIWLYYLGIRVSSGMLGGRHRGYHEAFLYTLSRPENPFFEVFNKPYLFACLYEAKKIRNEWRHDSLCFERPFRQLKLLVYCLSIFNDALEDAIELFSEKRIERRQHRSTRKRLTAGNTER